MQHLCVREGFVVLGVATACLSTALGSMFGSARIMQAIARDRIFPLSFFAHGAAHGDEPRRAIVLSYTVAQASLPHRGTRNLPRSPQGPLVSPRRPASSSAASTRSRPS
jgi:hypothetical protein